MRGNSNSGSNKGIQDSGMYMLMHIGIQKKINNDKFPTIWNSIVL